LVLEIFYAQYWAQTPEDEAENARAEILRLMRQSYVAADVGPEALQGALPMLQEAQVLAERFLEKVILRASQIREAKAQDHGHP